DAEVGQLEAAAPPFELDQLHRGGADVEPEDRLRPESQPRQRELHALPPGHAVRGARESGVPFTAAASGPKTRSLSPIEGSSASRILRFVSSRHGRPASTRSIVSVESPDLRASSALLRRSASRNRCTLLSRTSLSSLPCRPHGVRPSRVSAPAWGDLS